MYTHQVRVRFSWRYVEDRHYHASICYFLAVDWAFGTHLGGDLLASRSMPNMRPFKQDTKLCKLMTWNLPRSGSGGAGGGSRFCSRTLRTMPS